MDDLGMPRPLEESLSQENNVKAVFFCNYYLSLVWKIILGPLSLFFMRNGIVVLTDSRIWFYKFNIMGRLFTAVEKSHAEVRHAVIKEGRRSSTLEFVYDNGEKTKVSLKEIV